MDTYMKLRIILLIFSAIGFVLYLAAFAITKWSTHQNGSEGLWQMCYINAGVETCALWPTHLKSALLRTAQILSCFGLVFYLFFAVTGAMTIFWTKHWKKLKAMKYSTFTFAVLSVIFLAATVAIYKNDKGTGIYNTGYCWYLALVATVIAGIAAPFHLVDACRTTEPKKPDKEQFFKNINVPPQPTMAKFDISRQQDTLKSGNGGRPPLLSELRRHRTSFVHPPPKPVNKKLTTNDIQTFPLPPTKSKLDLFDKSEKEDHPSPQPPKFILTSSEYQVEDHLGLKNDCSQSERSVSTATTRDSVEDDVVKHSVFKFHKTKTIHKGGKTFLKIQNERDELPPVMMAMPGRDPDDDEITVESEGRTITKHQRVTQWDKEHARRKFGPYFVEEKLDGEDQVDMLQKAKKKFSFLTKKKSKVIECRVNDMSTAYTGEIQAQEKPQKTMKKRKAKKSSRSLSRNSDIETCVNTFKEQSFHSQDGVTIHNELEDIDV